MTLMTRRSLMAAGAAAVVFPQPGFALSAPAAQELVTRLIADVNTVISSGKSEALLWSTRTTAAQRHENGPCQHPSGRTSCPIHALPGLADLHLASKRPAT